MIDYDIVDTFKKNHIDLDDILDSVKYDFKGYVPKKASIEFVEFRKLIRGKTENVTPLVHYKILDNIFSKSSLDDTVLAHRGLAKTTIAEELFWYIATFGKIPNFGDTNLSLYVSDSIDNGVKTMKQSMDLSYEDSVFLQNMLPKRIITDIEEDVKKGYYSVQKEIAFVNAKREKSWLKMFGAQTGVRGTKIGQYRPEFAIFDDLIQKEEHARSQPTIESIESTVYSDVEDALHPGHRKIIWFGTPFNQNDPLYKAVVSDGWRRSVYPVCEKFPCKKEEFIGSWGERFTYEAVMATYRKRKSAGKTPLFYREMMLRVSPMEDRIVKDDDIVWFSRDRVLENKYNYNFYITTDFATSEKDSSDPSGIFVWAINNKGYKMLVDGIMKRQLMRNNIDDLFRFVKIYNPDEVGVEISGQQAGFIDWIEDEMTRRNIYFRLAGRDNKGIRPTKNKFERFMLIQPQFSLKRIWFAKELINTDLLQDTLNQLKKITVSGIGTIHDEAIDCISMLNELQIIEPSETSEMVYKNGVFEEDTYEDFTTKNNLIL